MRIRSYTVVEERIEAALRRIAQRAWKHRDDDRPIRHERDLLDVLIGFGGVETIMNELCEVIDFDAPEMG